MNAQLDADEVKHALRAQAVLDHYAIRYKRAGDQLESKSCPRRPDHDRRALVINRNTGLWWCHPCNYGGDLLHLVAELERLEIVRDFGAVLVKAADIAGVTAVEMNDDERAQRRQQLRQQRSTEEAAEHAERAQRDHRAIAIATERWARLARSHDRGVAYLTARGVRAALQYDLIRFDPAHEGSPSIPVHTRDGQIRNVVCRRFPEIGEPKTLGLYRCPTAGTMVNSVRDIERGRSVVLVEGVFDAITATLAWPHDIVLGAHSSQNLPAIAKLAAARCAEVGTRLVIVPHNDKSGYSGSRGAATAAINAGLSYRDGSLVIVHTGVKDLNDAWNAGWRAAA